MITLISRITVIGMIIKMVMIIMIMIETKMINDYITNGCSNNNDDDDN